MTKTQPEPSIISIKTGFCSSQRNTIPTCLCLPKDSSLQSFFLPTSRLYPHKENERQARKNRVGEWVGVGRWSTGWPKCYTWVQWQGWDGTDIWLPIQGSLNLLLFPQGTSRSTVKAHSQVNSEVSRAGSKLRRPKARGHDGCEVTKTLQRKGNRNA